MYETLLRLSYRLERNAVFSAVKRGLLFLLPVLVTGSVALMLRSLPVPAIHDFVQYAAGGVVLRLLDLVYDGTFGLMAVYLLCGISYIYAAAGGETDEGFRLTAVMAALGAFIASMGAPSGEFEFADFGAVGVFNAMFCAITATALFRVLAKRLPQILHAYAGGADRQFRASVARIVPLAVCVTVFAVCNQLVQRLFGVQNLNDLLAGGMLRLFRDLPGELGGGAAFVTMLGALWFFGIHGGNVMEQVAQSFFVPANADPSLIVGKSFLDDFALMGGCGATLCLLLALLLFSRERHNRKLAWAAAPFAVFNMNELVVFGLPVILNPVLLVPFLAVPVLSLGVAYGATVIGFLPPVTESINWTTPVLLSGYLATGSMRGAVMQLLLLGLGTAVYAPFIRLAERLQTARERMELCELLRAFEEEARPQPHTGYLSRPDRIGVIAKTVAARLRDDIAQGNLPVWSQPQVDEHGRVVGAEALLRWRFHGVRVPPPLAVSLAHEDGLFDALTNRVLSVAAEDCARFYAAGTPLAVSVNISAAQADDPAFVARVLALAAREGVAGRFCVEITEEEALQQYGRIEENLRTLRAQGVHAAIDDFSMGSTSIKYLQNNAFGQVKLDGELVRQLPENPRSREIVRSIIALGGDLGFEVVAEYVENEALRDILLGLGCRRFQGYLYSPAVPAGELIDFAKERI